MSTFDNLIKNMKKHSNDINLPLIYKDDLNIDFKVISKYGNCCYVWLLRDSGTALIPLKRGVNPLFIMNYIHDESARCFLINGYESGKFQELKKENVESMLNELPIDFSYITDSQHLINQITKLLDDDNVRCCGFQVADKCSSPAGWERLERFYDGGKNAVMARTMKVARHKLVALNHQRICEV